MRALLTALPENNKQSTDGCHDNSLGRPMAGAKTINKVRALVPALFRQLFHKVFFKFPCFYMPSTIGAPATLTPADYRKGLRFPSFLLVPVAITCEFLELVVGMAPCKGDCRSHPIGIRPAILARFRIVMPAEALNLCDFPNQIEDIGLSVFMVQAQYHSPDPKSAPSSYRTSRSLCRRIGVVPFSPQCTTMLSAELFPNLSRLRPECRLHG